MTKEESLAIFNSLISDSTNTSYSYLDLALKKINSFFGKKFIEEIEIEDDKIDIGDIEQLQKIDKIKIDDEEIEELAYFENWEEMIILGVRRWRGVINGKIYLTTEENGLTAGVEYSKNYEMPDALGSWEMEDYLIVLLFDLAVIFWLKKVLTTTLTNRENNPDAKPEEILNSIKILEERTEKTIEKLREK